MRGGDACADLGAHSTQPPLHCCTITRLLARHLPAAVVVETLYFYALAHQPDFDVCWAKGSGVLRPKGWCGRGSETSVSKVKQAVVFGCDHAC